MNLKQLLTRILLEWRSISGLDFCLFTEKCHVYLPPESHDIPYPEDIKIFMDQEEPSMDFLSARFFKIIRDNELVYVLIVWGEAEQVRTIGELAVCQIRSILETTKEKLDKNTYMQNLLMGNYTSMDMHNRAKRLRISTNVPRAVFIVQTKQNHDEHVLATIQGMFSARTGNFITSLNEETIILVKEMHFSDTYESLEQTALTLVDMLNTEVMTSAWTAYGNIANELSELPNAYKEARTALEVGKIFYPGQNTFGYKHLGIGHLIYQLPPDICEMFIDDTFKGEDLSSLDEETLNIIKTFFENNLNLSETSRKLYLHRNTLVYRIEKLEKRFGLDIRTFEDAMTFKLAMMVVEYTKSKRR